MFIISFPTFSCRNLPIGSIAIGGGLYFSTSGPEVVGYSLYNKV